MYYATCLFALALTLCAFGLTRAEVKAPPGNYEHLKGLEPLIGTWTGDWLEKQDRPTAGLAKDQKLVFTVTYKWNVNKSSITVEHTIGRPNSDPLWGCTWLIGWDSANKRIVCAGFEATGGHALTHDWEIKGDKVTFEGKGSLPAGNKTTWRAIFSDIKKESYVHQLTDMTVDGKKAPHHHANLTLKRVRAK